jgi:DNA-binding LacI/PurR family transcriptional regulator
MSQHRGVKNYHLTNTVSVKAGFLYLESNRRESGETPMNPPQPVRSITLKDIARKLGLSHGSVSKALRNDPEISKATRDRVQTAAREMDYQPNPMGAGLAEFKRSSRIVPVHSALAWINCWPEPKQLRSYKEFDRYWQGAQGAAERLGYHLEEFVCHGSMTPGRLEKVLLARGIHGILLPPHRIPIEWEDFHWENFSAVRFGRSLLKPRVHVVTADQVANGMIAFDSIRDRGYRRIGLVTQRRRCNDEGNRTLSHNISRDRRWLVEAGFLMAQAEVDESQRVPVLFLDVWNAGSNQAELEEWLKQYRADAVISDLAALPEMLGKAGYCVGKGIGFAATSVLDGNADAGIYQNPEEIGRVSVLVLTSVLNENARGEPAVFRQILVEGKWVDGASLPWLKK